MKKPLPPPGEHLKLVKDIFTSIPKRYALINHVLSLGQDYYWRHQATKGLSFPVTGRFLDVATGTADVALAVCRRYPETRGLGVDLVDSMLSFGQSKVKKHGLTDRLSLIRADATRLPFADNTFDLATMAFGIRNIPNQRLALEEMTRVVVPGGQVIILEMGLPPSLTGKLLFYPYLRFALPLLARLFSPNREAYSYLADSVIAFGPPSAFLNLMEKAGLVKVSVTPLTFGITCCYRGLKPGSGFSL
jgi:demethylmenaquinone methyltransferase/2-methoxy-6-polyprenyl-1,4-benzoquinol methylase